MINDLPVPKSNPISSTVDEKDEEVKTKNTDLNESEAGTYLIILSVFFPIINYTFIYLKLNFEKILKYFFTFRQNRDSIRNGGNSTIREY